MATKLPPVDALLVGFGWTGALLGQELSDAGLNVLALERGGWRDTTTDFATTFIQDELRYYYRHALFQEPARETLSFRNSSSETALPMRQLGSFLPGTGVGGAGVHWNGQNWRFLPTRFPRPEPQHGTLRRGSDPDRNDDPGLGRHVRANWSRTTTNANTCAASRGKAGNIKGQIQPGGNPFEGPRRTRVSESAHGDDVRPDAVRAGRE